VLFLSLFNNLYLPFSLGQCCNSYRVKTTEMGLSNGLINTLLGIYKLFFICPFLLISRNSYMTGYLKE